MLTGTVIGALGAAAAVIAIYLLGSWTRAAAPGRRRRHRRAAGDRACCWRSPRSPGCCPARCRTWRQPAHRGPRRHARAAADRRSGDVRADAGVGCPRSTCQRRPEPVRVRHVRQPSVHRAADGRGARVRARRPLSEARTLLVTNDFPPRPGGIQQFVHNLAIRQPAGSVVVYCSDWRGSAEFDAAQPFPVIREETSVLLPAPAVGRRAAAIAREHGCDTVWFGAAAPLGPARRRAAAPRRDRAGGRADARPRGRLGRAARRPGRCCSGSAAASTW